jgi:hypothetical protein
MTSATKVASWLSKEHHRSSQSNETSYVGATFACSLRAAKVKLGPEGFAKYKVVIFENNTGKSAVVDVHDTVYRPTTPSTFEMYFEEQDRVGVEQNIDLMTSSGGGSCQLAPGSPDVITMLMNADTFEWFKYRYNLEDSQVMKKYVRMCMRIAPSMGMEVKHDFQYDSGLIMPFFTMLSLTAIKEKCDTCGEDAKTRCNGCQKVYYCCRECQKADWKQHKTTCGHVFTVVNCSDYRAWSASRT